MQFVPGSHKLGVVKHIRVPPYNYFHVDQEIIDPYLDAGQVVDVVLDPVDIVLFNNLLFHQGQDNYSGIQRWSADFRYQDARQPTLTKIQGHLVRSQANPDQVIKSGEEWAAKSWS